MHTGKFLTHNSAETKRRKLCTYYSNYTEKKLRKITERGAPLRRAVKPHEIPERRRQMMLANPTDAGIPN